MTSAPLARAYSTALAMLAEEKLPQVNAFQIIKPCGICNQRLNIRAPGVFYAETFRCAVKKLTCNLRSADKAYTGEALYQVLFLFIAEPGISYIQTAQPGQIRKRTVKLLI